MAVDQSLDETNIGEVCRRAHALARAWWPEIELPIGQFARHLQRLHHARELPVHGKELYLCCACSLGSRPACRRLETDYFPALKAGLLRQCGREDFVEEVLQRVRERLLVGPAPKIASYEGRAPLSSWLQRVVRHAACDLYRKEKQARRIAAGWSQVVESMERDSQSEAAGSRPGDRDARCLGELERALLGAIGTLSMEDRRLIELYYVQGMSADEIGLCFERDRSTVYRHLNQITARIKRASLAIAREQTGIRDRQELDALFQANRSWIYLDPRVWLAPDLGASGSARARGFKGG